MKDIAGSERISCPRLSGCGRQGARARVDCVSGQSPVITRAPASAGAVLMERLWLKVWKQPRPVLLHETEFISSVYSLIRRQNAH